MAIKFNEFEIQDPAVLAALKEIVFELDRLQIGITAGDGDSIFHSSVYIRSVSMPSTPSVDDGSYNFSTQTLTPPSGWSTGVPSGTDPVYVSHGTFSINGVAGTDSTVTWSSPVILAQDGTSGGSGNSVFIGSVFLRKSTAPTTPIVDDGSYNFTTNSLTPPSTGGGSADDWLTSIPAGSDPLYVSTATFFITGPTGTDGTMTWSSPVIFSQDGATGTEGSSFFTGNVFIRAASPPSTPSVDDGSFNFTTNVLTPPSGWSANLPAGSDPLYVSSGSFSISGSTGTDSTVTWSSPDLLVSDGVDGGAGGDGDSILVANVYRRAASAPSTPSVNDGSYNFTTKTLTPPSGWSVSPPAGTDPLYVSTGTFAISGTTGTDNTVVWTSPDVLVQDGDDGSDGNDGNDGNDGSDGDDGVLHYLTNEAHVIPANQDGLGYSLVGAGGTHKVFEGISDETTNSTHSVQGGATKNGLTIAVVSGTGIYSLSGTAWTTDIEIFTLRAVFNGVNYEKTYTIAKAKKGSDGGCAIDTLTTINLADVGVNDPATVGFRVDNNGQIYERANNGAGYVAKETYIGACVNTEYECNYLRTGDSLTGSSATTNTWLVCSTDRLFELNTSGSAQSTGGTLQIRRTSDNMVIATVSVSMAVERFV